jgi:RimJ/RimL family protein N-acetyltransferase
MDYKITFRLLVSDDAKQLHKWLQIPHVREFWDDGNRTLDQVISYYFKDNGVKRFIFFIDDQPAGYIQSYFFDQANLYYQFTLPDQKTVGIDYFIGNAIYLGIGLARKILKNFIEQICQDADRILVDPDPANTKAIHVYHCCGFVKVSECNVENKTLQIMLAVPQHRFQFRELQQKDFNDLEYYFGSNTPYKNPIDKWKQYLAQQKNGERLVKVIEYKNHVIGIGTLKFNSDYQSFQEMNIPEINDVVVATEYWKQGFGGLLITDLENAAKEVGHQVIGLGVGLYRDYGKAQRLYFKLGYVPDGNGITYQNKSVIPGDQYAVDDNLLMWLTKNLSGK